jgi:exodeoxyribonuclease VII large subunit
LLQGQINRLDLLDAKLSAVDPRQALQRGYSITTTADGQLVRNADQVMAGAELVTRLAVGTLTSTVTASNSTHQEPND